MQSNLMTKLLGSSSAQISNPSLSHSLPVPSNPLAELCRNRVTAKLENLLPHLKNDAKLPN